MQAAPPPPALLDWLATTSREASVHSHSIRVGLDWWNQRHAGLAGLPVTADGQTTGYPRMTRARLFALAEDATSTPEGALRLLWHTLAWGTGVSQRRNDLRVAAVSVDPDRYASVLLDAARLSRTDPAAAFQLLRPGRRNTVANLGPNFSTKFLYFAGGGEPGHPCVIVDAVVRATLHRVTREPVFAPMSQYPVGGYLAAIDVLSRWAAEAGEAVGRPVAADEVELWAFRYAQG